MPHRKAARAVKSRWVRANEWLRYHPLPAYVLVVLVSAWGVGTAWEAGKDGERAGNEAKAATAKANKERAARIKIAGEINRYVCKENNKQDRILAGLIEVSLGGQTSFGQGIPSSQLGPFEEELIAGISTIQKLSEEAQPVDFEAAFKRAQAQLLTQTPCVRLANAFTEASDTQDYREIRRFLREIDRKDRQAANAAAPAP
jgi:hypothetical protein